jgi:hypothetical protein
MVSAINPSERAGNYFIPLRAEPKGLINAPLAQMSRKLLGIQKKPVSGA